MDIILDFPIGWLDGITASIIVFVAAGFGIFFIYKGIKLKANLLTVGGLMTIFSGALWMGPVVDFLWVLFTPTHQNIDNSILGGLYGILSYMWVAPTAICALYLGSKLLFIKKKTLPLVLTLIFVAIGVIFELVLFFFTETIFDFTIPNPPGSNIIEANFKRGSIGFILIAVFLISVVLINGIGSIIAAFNGTGMVRKRFIFLTIIWFLFVIIAVFDAFLAPGLFLFIVRLGMITEAILIYLALNPNQKIAFHFFYYNFDRSVRFL